ncbi:hypothetical protein BW247_04545 [Acidihalobacter ferrooxydans]|uniref:Uncharacterized protein n=1 Tax=Acidihalobacter ferrooxydans TaxID=1765967 RepID=A0A1P8UF16_9GAMM|nr:hypothetical protein BW247_04545 [Acidihalobacter ferrooxydans]
MVLFDEKERGNGPIIPPPQPILSKSGRLLAVLFLFNWPDSALWMVGLFVGISLLFDGWMLTAIGWSLRKTA